MARSAIIHFLLRPRWEPSPRRNRRGELVHPQVSPPVRVLSGCLSLFILWCATFAIRGAADVSFPFLLLTGSLAVGSGWIAVFGWNEVVVDPEASERFRELADPSRPLP